MADGTGYASESARCCVERRWQTMKQERLLVEPLMRELRDNFLPTRGRFPGEKPGEQAPRRNRLPNSTPLAAAATLASGLHAGLTSPARPWLRTGILDQDLSEFGPVKEWLATVDTRMLQWFARCGLYEALPFAYAEFGTFGTMCMLSFADPRRLVRFDTMTFGDYWLARAEDGSYDTCYRLLPFSVRQLVGKFGLDRLPAELQRNIKQGGDKALARRVDVLHAIEPDCDRGGWVGRYYIDGIGQQDANEGLLFEGRFDTNPIHAAAWESGGLDPYATNSPGITALGDAKALQVDERNKARAIDRHWNPPMQGPGTLRDAGVSLAPGSMTWVDGMQATGQQGRIMPVHEFTPDIRGLMDNIGRDEQRINSAFFRDLFLMLTLDTRNERGTAEEIRAKYDEKVLALGPTLEKSNAMLRGIHARVFDIMVRRSMPIWHGVLQGEPLLPPPPRELEDKELMPEFVSALQQAQRAQQLQGIERFAGFAGQFAQVLGHMPEKLDIDQALDEYAAGLAVPPSIVRDDAEVAAMRQQNSQQQGMQQMAAMAPALLQGAKAAQTMQQTQTGPTPQDNLLSGIANGMAQQVLG